MVSLTSPKDTFDLYTNVPNSDSSTIEYISYHRLIQIMFVVTLTFSGHFVSIDNYLDTALDVFGRNNSFDRLVLMLSVVLIVCKIQCTSMRGG